MDLEFCSESLKELLCFLLSQPTMNKWVSVQIYIYIFRFIVCLTPGQTNQERVFGLRYSLIAGLIVACALGESPLGYIEIIILARFYLYLKPFSRNNAVKEFEFVRFHRQSSGLITFASFRILTKAAVNRFESTKFLCILG